MSAPGGAPTRATLHLAAWVTGAGLALLALGMVVLRLVVCSDGTCPTGTLRTLSEVVAIVGFLVVLGGAAFGLTVAAHLAAVARRGGGDGDA